MNLLESKIGRFVTFGGLYFSEGVPAGLLMMAIATEIQRRGMEDPTMYTLFVSFLALPWAWKFLMGPFVDNIYFKRFGACKQWIVTAQCVMISAFVLALIYMPQKLEVVNSDGAWFMPAAYWLVETLNIPPLHHWLDFVFKGIASSLDQIVGTAHSLLLSGLGLFAGLLLLQNTCAATQDVAIDALACRTLKEDERGLANGIMSSCSMTGYLVGGSLLLALKHQLEKRDMAYSFEIPSAFIIVVMLCITLCVIVFVREKTAEQQIADGELPAREEGVSPLRAFASQIADYFKTLWSSVILTRNGFLGILLSLTPIGGLALTMLLTGLIAPRIGMNDGQVAALNLASTVIFFPFNLLGGWLSDRFGRRLLLGVTATLTVLPGLWMAAQFKAAGFAHAPDQLDSGMWPAQEDLITSWWIAVLTFKAFFAMSSGVKLALFMDIVNPKVAATQFTAMMSFTSWINISTQLWQGLAISTDNGWGWSYWKLLYVDSAVGLLFLIWLCLIKPRKRGDENGGEPSPAVEPSATS